MKVFSDFTLFERAPRNDFRATARWIAWRFICLGLLLLLIAIGVGVVHFVAGEPLYYVNEQRNLTDIEALDFVGGFAGAGIIFSATGWLAIYYFPRRPG